MGLFNKTNKLTFGEAMAVLYESKGSKGIIRKEWEKEHLNRCIWYINDFQLALLNEKDFLANDWFIHQKQK